MTDEELLETGRQNGAKLLEAAVRGATDDRTLSEQIFVCRSMAIHILAHELWNRAKLGANVKAELKDIQEQLVWELSELEGGHDLVTFQGLRSKKPRLTLVKADL